MHFCIHRGSSEIGGSCVEIFTKTTRIVVDLGMPLVDRQGDDFDSHSLKNKKVKQLIDEKILPDIEGLYDQNNPVDGLLISHPHQDHYGLLKYITGGVPVYLGKATHELIKIGGLFANNEIEIKNPQYFSAWKSFTIGDIKITPYLMDHSAFDSYLFLIEGEGKRLIYSGDFRSHGRKGKLFEHFKTLNLGAVDVLLMEGTVVSREEHYKNKPENFIEQEIEKLFKESKPNLVYASGQNIDRIVSLYRAAKRNKKIFVIDLYQAAVLEKVTKFTRNKTIPYPSASFPEIRVYFPQNQISRLYSKDRNDIINRLYRYRIKVEEISKLASRIVMLVRPSYKNEKKLFSGIKNGNIVYSLWSGYLKKPYTSSFIDLLENKYGYTMHHIHTGGHADVQTLQELVEAVNPKQLVPMHTFSPEVFKDFFNAEVRLTKDGEIIKV